MGADHAVVTSHTRGSLAPWLEWLDAALHREIVRLRARYELSMDELRGLYVSDEQVDRLVADRGIDGEQAVSLPPRHASTIGVIARRFSLTDSEVAALAVCVAPELDVSYQTLFAYLNDDVTRRLPTVDLCQRLGGAALLEPDSPVLREGLIVADARGPVWRSTALHLTEPTRRFLLGTDPLSGVASGAAPRIGLVLLEARAAVDARSAAGELTAQDGRPLVELDESVRDFGDRIAAGVLRARLHDAALFVPSLGEEPPADLLAALVAAPVTVLLGTKPGESARLALGSVDHQVIVVDRPDVEVRRALWEDGLARRGVVAAAPDVAAVAALFELGPAQIDVATIAVAREGSVDLAALTNAARERTRASYEGLAERVDLTYVWDDLVLPSGARRRLQDLRDAIGNRHLVFDDWQLGRLHGGHTSVRALFSGPSGTGKTMSAAVLARDLGLELLRVDLAAVISKYIGETEKHLARIFDAAEASSALLFFDEADALFGKRTEVKDAHDRYANIETSYLLQRMESFDGVVVLATNLAGNLDDAFARRLQFHIEFPMPDERLRTELWRKALPHAAPIDGDVDPAFLAAMFPMTGGDVRGATLAAAFAAAAEGAPIGMRHLVGALGRQRHQQGKVPSVAEFGDYLSLARDEA